MDRIEKLIKYASNKIGEFHARWELGQNYTITNNGRSATYDNFISDAFTFTSKREVDKFIAASNRAIK